MISRVSGIAQNKPQVGRSGTAPKAEGQQDSFAPSEAPSPDLRALFAASPFSQSRNSPSGKLKAVVDQGVKIRGPEGLEKQIFQGSAASVQWLDNQQLLVTADGGGDEKYKLHLIQADGSKSVTLGGEQGSQELCFRKGNLLYFRSDAERQGNFDLEVFDRSTGETRKVFQGEGDVHYDMLLDDGRLVATRSESNTTNTLLLLSPNGQSKELLSGSRNRAVRMLSGNELLVFSNQGREFSAPYRLNLDSGSMTLLANTTNDVEQVAWNTKQDQMAVAVNDQGFSKLAIYDGRGELLTNPSLPDGVVTQISFKDDIRLKFSLNSADAPQRTGELNLSNGQVQWTKSEDISNLGLVKPELVHYPSLDGTQIPAFLYRPQNVDPNRPQAAVIQLHGGPDSQTRPRFDPTIQHLVDQGITVITPNVRGSTGYGQSYLDADNGVNRTAAVSDVKAAADFLTLAGIDSTHIALMGHSYGGYLALAALATYPEQKWAAAVDQSGPTNLESTLDNLNDPYRAEFGTDPQLLKQLSPLSHVDQIEAPLLIIHGQNDSQVSISESEQMVSALQGRGKEVEYQVLPQEGHIIRNAETKLKTHEAISDFLISHLKK
jgi:dipeptidyl aminopeptidase/acylaminoacyl peptidase